MRNRKKDPTSAFKITEDFDDALMPLKPAEKTDLERYNKIVKEDLETVKYALDRFIDSQAQLEFAISTVQLELAEFQKKTEKDLKIITELIRQTENSDQIAETITELTEQIRELKSNQNELESKVSAIRDALIKRFKVFQEQIQNQLQTFFRNLFLKE